MATHGGMAPFLLVGTKADLLLSKPEVRGLGLSEKANDMAKRLGAFRGRCFETSALNDGADNGVIACFDEAVRSVISAGGGAGGGGCCIIS